MRISALVGGAAAFLLVGLSTGQDTRSFQTIILPILLAPSVGIIKRGGDFSANSGHWFQLQQLMHNIHSRIGVPFSAMRNVGLKYNQTLEIDPTDIVLLPSGYCFSCAIAPDTQSDGSKQPNPFNNQMVELDEAQLIVACADPDDSQNTEWPLMKACPGQEHVLKDFLIDLTSDGSRLAVPKARLEQAPVFQVNKHTCIPKDPHQTTCSPLLSSTSATTISPPSAFETATTSKLHVQNFALSIYSHESTSTTAQSSPIASTSPGASNATETLATRLSKFSTFIEPRTASISSSATPTPFKHVKPWKFTWVKRGITAGPTSAILSPTTDNAQLTSTSVDEQITAAPTSRRPSLTKLDEPTLPTASLERSADGEHSATSATIALISSKGDKSSSSLSNVVDLLKPDGSVDLPSDSRVFDEESTASSPLIVPTPSKREAPFCNGKHPFCHNRKRVCRSSVQKSGICRG